MATRSVSEACSGLPLRPRSRFGLQCLNATLNRTLDLARMPLWRSLGTSPRSAPLRSLASLISEQIYRRVLRMPDLIVDHVAKQYPTRSEPLQVLRDISLEMSAGQNLAILGPSGSGKSTLLYVIGTLDPPSNGTVTLGGQDPYRLPEKDLADFRNRNIGFIFQDHHLLPQLSVLENVLIPTLAAGPTSADQRQRAEQLLERVGLRGRLEHRPAELSGGERGRVAVARALVTSPKMVLADEPTGNLDHTNAMAVAQLLLKLQQEENTMLIVVTHSTELAGMLQQRQQLDNGRLRAELAE